MFMPLFPLLDSPGPWNPLIISMVLGGILLAVGVLGGGIKIKELEIPELKPSSRVMAGIFGVCLLGYGLYETSRDKPRIDLHELKPLSCSLAASLKSPKPNKGDTSILFLNETDVPVQVYWIDRDGNLQGDQYPTLDRRNQEHDHWRQQTFEGDSWMIKDNNGRCLGVFIATAQDSVVHITEK